MLFLAGHVAPPPIDVLLVHVADDVALDEGQLVRLLSGVIIASLKKLLTGFKL